MSYFGRDTVTLFNVYEGNDGSVAYYPTVFYDVDMQNDFNAHAGRTGLSNADRSVLIIDVEKFTKPMLPFVKWEALLNEELEDYFTVNTSGSTGGGKDFFMEGIYLDILDSRSAEKLRKQSNNAFVVQSFGDYHKYGHIEIGGA